MDHFTASDDALLHYVRTGEGGPLVFLHGWTSNHREWLPFAEALADQHTCVCWDARGHGGHPNSNVTPNSVQRMARDLSELLAHLDLGPATLLGHSMGALTVWEYVREFGCTTINRLVLVDQSPKLLTDNDWRHGIYGNFTDDQSDTFLARLEDDFSEAVLTLIGESNNPRARTAYAMDDPGLARVRDYLRKLEPEPLIEVWKSLTLADYRDVLPAIEVPTLLVHGDTSHFYSVELAEYIRGAIPDARLHVYEGTDHSPHLWQRERFLDDLRTFCLGNL
ncbi:MAG: alpha/beta hydrolase [Gammaproteobacteria bacterium]|nr:MAG: alpha/beta hydrolase [Gammaproteobacteria bacterium]